jgi:membrane-bound inhibitor of C-type lysozyme
MIIIAAAVSVWFVVKRPSLVITPPIAPAEVTPSTESKVVNRVSYACDGNRLIKAAFMERVNPAVAPTPDAPPTPTGSVSLVFDDAPAVLLSQSISADGARYATVDEALVFWSKGNAAIVLDHGQDGMYTNCIATENDPGTLPFVYHDGAVGFTVRYPSDFLLDVKYIYNSGQKMAIPGVKFTIPEIMATGTNLSVDSYVSVEHVAAEICDAMAFSDHAMVATSTTVMVGDVTYSFASSTDAGAGNRYEESVYVLPTVNQCLALRYFVHYGAIENYDAGTIKTFDRAALLSVFDRVRDSVVFEPRFAESNP